MQQALYTLPLGGIWVGPAESNRASSQNTLRRVKRLALVVIVSCLSLGAALTLSNELSGDMRAALALLVAVVASWAIVNEVTGHIRWERANRDASAQAARLEGARLTATAMQDRIANKLSLTVGYCEFLANDARLPSDLREQAEKAMMGARAAAETVSELKRLTNANSVRTPAFLDGDPAASESSQVD